MSTEPTAGSIRHIAFSSGRGLPRPLHGAATLAAGHGIVGDRRAGRSPERALNVLDERHLVALAAAGYPVGPGSLGENVVLAGLDLDALPAGTRLALGDRAVIRIVKARTGCQNLAYLHADFPEASAGRVGQMCAVEAEGEIRVGDPVRVLER